MRNVFTIAYREMRYYLTTPVAYVVAIFFLFLTGLIFTFSIFQPGARAEMRGLMGSMVFLTLMVIPFITMSLLAREHSTGTVELLLTKPVRDLEVVIGKYVGALALYLGMLIFTLPYPLIMSKYGDLDWGPVWVGYLGLLLAAMAFVAIGLFASSLTRSQMASAGMCLGIFLFFWLIGWVSVLVGQQGSLLSDIAKNIWVFEVSEAFQKGVLDLKNVVYFLSLAFLSIFLSIRVLEMRRQV